MRFFVALEIPGNSQRQIQQVQEEIKQLIPEIRLTDQDKLHLTIAFVGEQPDSLQANLVEVLKEAVVGIPSFLVSPAYLDGFPNLHHPHTLWLGVKGDIDKLFIIRERVKDGLEALNLATDERRYIPHIAIAKLSKNFQLLPYQEAEFEKIDLMFFQPIPIISIKLFESVPEEGFHRHNTLAQIPLTAA